MTARRAVRPDAGVTLTELLVTMMIMGIVVSATVTLLIAFQRSNAENLSRQEQIDNGRTAIQAMSRTLRSAVKPAQLPACAAAACPEEAFIQASDFAVRFYANLNNPGNSVGPSRVEYSIPTSGPNAGDLVEAVQTPNSNVPGPSGSYEYCDARSAGASAACRARLRERVVAFGVLTDSGQPLITYYNQAGVRMVPPAGGSLGATDMAGLLALEVHVRVQADNAVRAEPTEYVQRITLPNAAALIRQLEEETP